MISKSGHSLTDLPAVAIVLTNISKHKDLPLALIKNIYIIYLKAVGTFISVLMMHLSWFA